MNCISLWEPWGSLWLSPAKIHETRVWKTQHRGPILVHAAGTRISFANIDPALDEVCLAYLGADYLSTRVLGALIGVLVLEDVVSTDFYQAPLLSTDFVCGNWRRGRYAWRRGPMIRRFKEPIPYKGMQRVFNVPDSVIEGHVMEVVYG